MADADVGPLTNSTGWQQALHTFRALVAAATPVSNPGAPLRSCGAVSAAFAAGACAMTLDWDMVFPFCKCGL
jgi:hypothetical protein